MQTLAQFVWVPRVQTQSTGSRLSAVSMIFILTVSLISDTVLTSNAEDNAADFQVSFLFSRKSQSTKVFYKEEGQPWSGNNFFISRQIQRWNRMWPHRFARLSHSSSGRHFPSVQTRLSSPVTTGSGREWRGPRRGRTGEKKLFKWH